MRLALILLVLQTQSQILLWVSVQPARPMASTGTWWPTSQSVRASVLFAAPTTRSARPAILCLLVESSRRPMRSAQIVALLWWLLLPRGVLGSSVQTTIALVKKRKLPRVEALVRVLRAPNPPRQQKSKRMTVHREVHRFRKNERPSPTPAPYVFLPIFEHLSCGNAQNL